MSVLQVPMQQLRGTTAQWAATDYILRLGQIGAEYNDDDELQGFKFGDGTSGWGDLPYASSTTIAALISMIAATSPEDALSLLSALAVASGQYLFMQPFDEEAEDWSPPDAEQFLIVSSSTALADNIYPVTRVAGEDWLVVDNTFSGTDGSGNPISRTFGESNIALDAGKTILALTPSGTFSITITANHRGIKLTAAGNSTISGITGLEDMQTVLMRFVQDGTGTRTLTKPGAWLAGADTLVGDTGNVLEVNTGAAAVTEFTLTGMPSGGVKIRKVLS